MRSTVYTVFISMILAALLVVTQGCCRPRDGETGAQGLPGVGGNPGIPGTPGSNGYNSVAAILPTASGCAAGGTTLLVALDTNNSSFLDEFDSNIQSSEICNGVAGIDGSNGQDGSNGNNGTNGSDGINAPPTPFTPVGIIDPCGDAPGIYDEVFLQLANGTILASFSSNASGLNTRFSVLVPGSYVTTDGSNCYFTVNSSNQVVY